MKPILKGIAVYVVLIQKASVGLCNVHVSQPTIHLNKECKRQNYEPNIMQKRVRKEIGEWGQ